ncbi:Peptidoglycan/LPS O-acetylase OafA/YrhL, contains acyltransferase and SGNH-hydrolase domains [Hymenobacter gelipurpurascens]|uniref:Peptidoglycan/LPS O-acetylase OafA/YrhL, contains acyltransferase and SGNH-hydrolase domains n=1 Tax=Hymenobacter gelipurpurascens TaxID=89968 RepID=A0A212T8M9_9BACT|nr:acyltransferase [Hymenobacter gelipurpurascens]SNC62201.1 Peptidoglycan/LPS O-acetylase OafA/YrhL, contains acyltransferase and SGNH-hydrolase domains [Hymenobacter gelipurpurascens]
MSQGLRPRLHELDILRFIAALSVLFYHLFYHGYNWVYQWQRLSPVEYPGLGAIFKYGYLGVELFFLISGYVILLSAQNKSVKQFFISRVVRLYPAYWIACTFCFAVVRIGGPAYNTPAWRPELEAGLKAYLANMTMFHSLLGIPDLDTVFWSLTIELCLYLLIALLIVSRWLKHINWVLAGLLLLSAVASGHKTVGAYTFLLFPQYAPYFVGGMVFCLLQQKPSRWLYLLLAAAYGLSLYGSQQEMHFKEWMYKEPFSFAVAFIIITLCYLIFLLLIKGKLTLGQSRWYAWLGGLSYPLYLIHQNLSYIVFRQFSEQINKYALLLLLLLGIGTLASLLFWLDKKMSPKFRDGLQHLLGND